MSDGKYFATTKRGEISELKDELRSLDKPKKKDAVKKVIAAMTVGKDVSMLFPDVVNCMQTEDLELKKLVYLYLINYAKTQPDLAIMAVNTFVKDSQDPNPLIRALAVRTMGCIRVDKITEYLCDPLQRCLKDDDPYVRKTAAVCVAKLYDINPELVEDRGFLDMLRDMLSDANPMVVSNALAALQEISDLAGRDLLQLTSHTLFKLLTALNECTEWGQVYILDSLCSYETKDPKDAEKIVERVLPRLQHVNSAVVLSAIKVMLKMMDLVTDENSIKLWTKKMAPPLVTLLSAEPEVQYVALRNINLIVQKRPAILANEVRVFFCKYNDPIYVKLEKLEIMIRLASEKNIDQLLLEFKEYAQEVDVDFVNRSVRAIGRCAVAIERAAERCINVLLELIATKVSYIAQAAVIVMRDIYRRYPGQYEGVISVLSDVLEGLDDPEAKGALAWIVGEYADRIDNSDTLLETFLETYQDETPALQLQLLTATVKLFLKKPNEKAQQLISSALSAATESDNPDLRDRAYIYWRLLSTDPEAAKDVVLADRPVMTDDAHSLDPTLLNALVPHLSSLASIYHKPPELFVSRQRQAVQRAADLVARKFEEDEAVPTALVSDGNAAAATGAAAAAVADLLDLSLMDAPAPAPPLSAAAAAASAATTSMFPSAPPPPPQAPSAAAGLDDLLGGLYVPPPQTAAPPVVSPVSSADPFASMAGAGRPAASSAASSSGPSSAPLPLLLTTPGGLCVAGRVIRSGSQLYYQLSLRNDSAAVIDGLMLQTNRSSWGITPVSQALSIASVPPSATVPLSVSLTVDANKILQAPPTDRLEVALKTNQQGVVYWADRVPLPLVTDENGRIESAEFIERWKGLPESSTRLLVTPPPHEALKAKLQGANVFALTHRTVHATGQEALYASARLIGGVLVLLELKYSPNVLGMDVAMRSHPHDASQYVFAGLQELLS